MVDLSICSYLVFQVGAISSQKLKRKEIKNIDIVERTRKPKKKHAKSINLEMQQPQELWSAHPYALCVRLSKQSGTCPTSSAYSQ